MGLISAVAGVLTPIALAVLDDLVVQASSLHAAHVFPWWKTVLHGFEVVSGAVVHPLFGPLVVATAALVCAARAPWRPYARPLVFVALCWTTTLVGVAILKIPFGRLRPRDLLTTPNAGAISAFFRGGGSFPSAYAAHAFGLALPLAILLPRWRILLLVVAVLVAFARVANNDHYLADVLASLALAALVTWLLARMLLPDSAGAARISRPRRARST
jgi:membrane-associated phospholipid phosphatase